MLLFLTVRVIDETRTHTHANSARLHFSSLLNDVKFFQIAVPWQTVQGTLDVLDLHIQVVEHVLYQRVLGLEANNKASKPIETFADPTQVASRQLSTQWKESSRSASDATHTMASVRIDRDRPPRDLWNGPRVVRPVLHELHEKIKNPAAATKPPDTCCVGAGSGAG